MTSVPVTNRLWLVLAPVVGVAVGAVAAFAPHMAPEWALVALLLVLLPFALVLARDAHRFLVALLLFETAVPLDMFLGFREDAADISALPGLPISLTTLLLGAAYLHWTISRLARTAPPDAGWGTAVAPLAFYFGAVLLAWLGAADTQLAGFEVGMLLQLLLLFGYLVHVIRTEADLRFAGRVVVAVLLVESLIMVALLALGRSVTFGPFLARLDTDPFVRVAGTVGSPTAAGAFLVLLMLPTLGWWRAASSRAGKLVAAGTFVLAFSMLIFTLTRGAWLGFAVGGLFFILAGSARGWLPRRFVLGVFLVGTVALLALAGIVSERLLGGEASPIADRVALTEVGVSMFVDHPLTGVGPNGFSAALPDYLDARFEGGFVSVVHNKYVLVAAETGIVGLLAFLVFFGVTLARGWRAVRLLPGPTGVLVLGILAGLLGVGVHMFFDLFHGRTDTQVLIAMCALLTAAWRVAQRSPAPLPAEAPPATELPSGFGAGPHGRA